MPIAKVCQNKQTGSLARQRRNENKCNRFIQKQNAPANNVKKTNTNSALKVAVRQQAF